jgi:hypothetical protein
LAVRAPQSNPPMIAAGMPSASMSAMTSVPRTDCCLHRPAQRARPKVLA